MQKNQSNYMKSLALSIGREAWSDEDGPDEVRAGVGPCLAKRVPWGACFGMGINLEESMQMSTLHGVKKVPFSDEVCDVMVGS